MFTEAILRELQFKVAIVIFGKSMGKKSKFGSASTWISAAIFRAVLRLTELKRSKLKVKSKERNRYNIKLYLFRARG